MVGRVESSMGRVSRIHRAARVGVSQQPAMQEASNLSAHHHRTKSSRVDRLAFGHCHCPKSPSMIASLHDDDILPTRGHPGELDRRLYGLCARVPKEEAVECRMGDMFQELLDERQLGPTKSDVDLRMNECSALLLRRGSDARMTVAQIDDSDAGCEIEELVAGVSVQVGSTAFCKDVRAQSAYSTGQVVRAKADCGRGLVV